VLHTPFTRTEMSSRVQEVTDGQIVRPKWVKSEFIQWNGSLIGVTAFK